MLYPKQILKNENDELSSLKTVITIQLNAEKKEIEKKL